MRNVTLKISIVPMALFLTLLSVTLAGCTSTRITGFVTRNNAGIPNICNKSWMQDQTYADDGDGVQTVGEDTPETVSEARMKNAGKDAYCQRRSPQGAGPQ